MAEIAAAAARLARGERRWRWRSSRSRRGLPRGRRRAWCASSSTPAATRACGRPTSSAPSPTRPGVPGKAIGAIDIYDRFTFVEVPSEYAEQVLAGMRHVKIRSRPVTVKLATPRAHEPGPKRQGHKPVARKRRRVA